MAKTTFITPVGIARYPHLNEPDNRFGDNKFKCGLILDEEGFAKFKAVLDDFVKGEKFVAKKPQMPWEQDEEDPTKFYIKASTGYRPGVFDSANNPLPATANVGGGSRVRLMVEFFNYDKGVSLRLKQVQVIELREWTGGSAFEKVDDGYTAPASSGFSTAESDDSDSESEDALSI